jgi:hypothetical protein
MGFAGGGPVPARVGIGESVEQWAKCPTHAEAGSENAGYFSSVLTE